MPFLDSPSVFASLLDPKNGGSFTIRPAIPIKDIRQYYLPETNILRTEFVTEAGSVELTDWFHMGTFAHAEEEHHRLPALYRRVRCLQGAVPIHMIFDPRPDYARAVPTFHKTDRGIVATAGENGSVELRCDCPFRQNDRGMEALLQLSAGQSHTVALAWSGLRWEELPDGEESLAQTESYWKTWVHDCEDASCTFIGRWNERVIRSALVLKILAGGRGIAAAATTSLPEILGGSLNWDYRFSWIRDASFTVEALTAMGHLQDAREYFDWLCTLLSRDALPISDLRVLYPLHGSSATEEELPHLSGYGNSRPVRVGNAAAVQRQLDIYGQILESFYRSERLHLAPIQNIDTALVMIIDFVCDTWRNPDHSIWELREEPRHYTYSKVMCWVALDRGIRLADRYGWRVNRKRWEEERDAVHAAVLQEGFNKQRECFTQSFGDPTLDATALLFPQLGFLPPEHPYVRSTLRTIERDLTSNELVYRSDMHHGKEGAFMLCSFWLVNALVMDGRKGEATDRFLALLDRGNHLGLYSEMIDPHTGHFLGNFPQAFTHVGLINSAFCLERAQGK